MKEAGYAFVYISNDNPTQVEVYFDDVTITHTPTNIIQYNEYYPFGLQAATSWTRENNKNDYLYNAGSELNATSGWYETFFRSYDPVLGRFMQIDPMASVTHTLSPYQYADCNPVLFNDPSGLLRAPKDLQEPDWSPWITYMSGDGDGYVLPGSVGGRSHWSDQYHDDKHRATFGRSSDYLIWNPWTQEYLPLNSVEGRALLKNKGNDPRVEVVRKNAQHGGASPIPDEKTWYTVYHSKNYDIVREHQITHTNFGYTETTRVVTITYGEGEDHKIEKYGYETREYYEYGTFEQWEKSPYISSVLGVIDKMRGSFWDQIYRTVNSHLGCDCYKEMVPKGRLNAGAPNERQRGNGKREPADQRVPEHR